VPEHADIAVIGAGAAGLFAAIWAGRRARQLGLSLRIVAIDSAKKLGAKILVAGGGRCNVTHHAVDESAYAGSSRHAIKQVLRAFTVDDTVAFFADLGVSLEREDTGKLFPTTDDANTILDALLAAAADAGVELLHPYRVDRVERVSDAFLIHPAPREPQPPIATPILARRLILCTGGMALPRTGSDGHGYAIARSLGHTVTPLVFPALVPLVLHDAHPIRALSGLTLPAQLTATTATGKHLASFTNSTLCTHFGLSGPSVLDISRYYLAERLIHHNQPDAARLLISWLPGRTPESLDAELSDLSRRGDRRSLARFLHESCAIPERLAHALCTAASLAPTAPLHTLTRDQRRALAAACCAMPLPVERDRGFTHAEVTAGGVPLSELTLRTMESRPCHHLHLAGEILDVDGRIGGFNFQWAWASGFLAGRAAAESLRVTGGQNPTIHRDAGPTPD
jgi:hypothetical protein